MSLPTRTTVDITDPDEAHAFIQATYVDHSVRVSGRTGDFRFRHQILDAGSFFVAHYRHSMTCRVTTDPFGFVLVGQLLGGGLRTREGRAELTPAVGDVFLNGPSTPVTTEWADVQVGLVRVDLALLDRVAAEATGDPATRVTLGLALARSREQARHWQDLIRYLSRDFCRNAAAYASPLIHQQTLRMLAATVLETFPTTTTCAAPDRPGGVDPSAVRRAVAFIDEHAAEPIGLTEIAAAARLGTRTVQEAFRRHLSTTPMAYLRRVRLERAHRDLQAADPAATTVADVATRWGFAHHGRFAALYQAQFGQAPSRTLRA